MIRLVIRPNPESYDAVWFGKSTKILINYDLSVTVSHRDKYIVLLKHHSLSASPMINIFFFQQKCTPEIEMNKVYTRENTQ